MSYGSAEGVASFAGTWTNDGQFVDPDAYQDGSPITLSEVTAWLEEVSQMVDIAFANEGFAVPITLATVLKAVDAKVNAMVSDLVHLANQKGRLFSEGIQESGRSPEAILESEIMAWVTKRAKGFEAMGVPRVIQQGSQQAYSVPMGRQL